MAICGIKPAQAQSLESTFRLCRSAAPAEIFLGLMQVNVDPQRMTERLGQLARGPVFGVGTGS